MSTAALCPVSSLQALITLRKQQSFNLFKPIYFKRKSLASEKEYLTSKILHLLGLKEFSTDLSSIQE